MSIIYNAVKFDAPLKAMWAVFFDELGFTWESRPIFDGCVWDFKVSNLEGFTQYYAVRTQRAEIQHPKVHQSCEEEGEYITYATLIGTPSFCFKEIIDGKEVGLSYHLCPRCGAIGRRDEGECYFFDHSYGIHCQLCDFNTPSGAGNPEEYGVITGVVPCKGVLCFDRELFRNKITKAASKANDARFILPANPADKGDRVYHGFDYSICMPELREYLRGATLEIERLDILGNQQEDLPRLRKLLYKALMQFRRNWPHNKDRPYRDSDFYKWAELECYIPKNRAKIYIDDFQKQSNITGVDMFEKEIIEIKKLSTMTGITRQDRLENALRIGEIIRPIKRELGNDFGDWLKENVGTFASDTAQTYMRLFRNKDHIKGCESITDAKEALSNKGSKSKTRREVPRGKQERIFQDDSLQRVRESSSKGSWKAVYCATNGSERVFYSTEEKCQNYVQFMNANGDAIDA